MAVPVIVEEAPEIIPAIETVDEAGQVIRVRFDQAFPGQAPPWFISAQGTQTKIAKTWDSLYDYVTEPFKSQTAPATLNMPAVIQAFQAPLERQLQVTSTYTNLLADFLNTFAYKETWERLNLGQTMTNLFENTQAQIDANDDQLRYLEHLSIPALQGDIARLRAAQVELQRNVLLVANQWGLDNIFRPLHENINDLEARTNIRIKAGDEKTLDDARSLINAHDAELAAGLGAVALAVKALQSWVDDCGEPMCQQFGPKTDMSSLLKKLLEGGILGLLAGFALADPTAVAQAAVAFAQVSGPAIENTVGDWLQGLHDVTA